MKKTMLFDRMFKDSHDGSKKLSVLIDPDHLSKESLRATVEKSVKANIDYFFVGGSLIMDDCLDMALQMIKDYSDIPSVIFPGNNLQINSKADALLFLSLISGRNPEFLIGKHVVSAPILAKTDIELISTGYMLVDSGGPTAASYMSNTQPIPRNKENIAVSTAMAGEFLGMKLIFMDGGSGAKLPITSQMIEKVKQNISCPLIIGGGIRTKEKVKENFDAGADVIVVGNAIEKDISFIEEIADQRY